MPHNVYLCGKYGLHINVEICTTIKAIKYLYKYIYKGSDQIIAKVKAHQANNTNEIESYIDCRYVSSEEACWRIMAFHSHKEKPNVETLMYHLPNEQTIYFTSKSDIKNLSTDKKLTQFLAWFELNKIDYNARQYTYLEIPKYYTFQSDHCWHRRKNKQTYETVSRFATASIKDPERFYLRLLLHHVKGPTSYEDLLTVNGILCDTFAKAAELLGIASEDREWDECLREASLTQMTYSLQKLFVTILVFCNPVDPLKLWLDHRVNLSFEYMYLTEDEAFEASLFKISELLAEHGKSLSDYKLPAVKTNTLQITKFDDELIESEAVKKLLTSKVEKLIPTLNLKQKSAYDAIMCAYYINEGGIFFIDGPAGSGKTYLYNLLIASIRSQGDAVIAVAFSGIAAILLDGGKTSHSRFSIPLNLKENSTCSIDKQSVAAAKIRQSKLIVWDEASMTNRLIINAVNRTLQDITGINNKPFGGILTVFGGDMRQTLPVIPKASRGEIISMCIFHSDISSYFQILHLSENMRLTDKNSNYIAWLQSVGEDKISQYVSN